MNKLLKSRKALSPVIASIILVAVTVAVSIAVAAWMGALTFSFTKTAQFNVASMSYFGTSGSTNYINMTIQNTGNSPWTLTNTAQVNSVTGLTVNDFSVKSGTAYNCTNGNSIKISITMSPGWISGNQYSVTLFMTSGTKITYVSNAP